MYLSITIDVAISFKVLKFKQKFSLNFITKFLANGLFLNINLVLQSCCNLCVCMWITFN